MKSKPLISILVACYNGERFIDKCLESITEQTYSILEILVVNDGSTDSSFELLSKWSKIDNRIKIINQENKGISKTRNVLLDKSTGDYLYFVDVDDWIELDAINKFVKIVLLNNPDFIANSFYKSTTKKDCIFYISNNMNDINSKKEYLIKNTPFAWGILIRKKFITDNDFRFNERSDFFEDAGVMTYWIYKAKIFCYLREPQYHYFVNKSSISRGKKMNFNKITSAIEQLDNFYRLLDRESFDVFPREINDQLAFYHCIIFTYINFQSEISRKNKVKLKKHLQLLEIKKLKYPKIYWKFWYFVLYRLFMY
ncbi:MAG: glycosyltransferase [Mycoplasmataceae bacterium]|nr:glycosyltransferase [Mycoplasmataceae bacterium]